MARMKEFTAATRWRREELGRRYTQMNKARGHGPAAYQFTDSRCLWFSDPLSASVCLSGLLAVVI